MDGVRVIRFWMALSVALVCGAALTAQPADYVDPAIGEFEAGHYCPAQTIDRRPAPGTSAGHTDVVRDKPVLISNTRIIEARPDNTFGVYARLSNPNEIRQVTIRITHPPFKNAEKTTVELDTASLSGAASSGYTFSFDYPYEFVTGIWTFEALQGDLTLYRATFTVVPPSSDAPHACGPPPTS